MVQKAADKLHIVSCLAGGEAEVDTADALSEALKVRTNGTEIPNRRDKKIQQQLIKRQGLRSVCQAGSSKFEDVTAAAAIRNKKTHNSSNTHNNSNTNTQHATQIHTISATRIQQQSSHRTEIML